MIPVFKEDKLHVIAVFNSEFGKHIIQHEYDPERFIRISISDIAPIDHTVMDINKENLLEKLYYSDEEEYFQLISSKKFIKKLINSNVGHVETIESMILQRCCGDITVIYAIDVMESDDHFLEAIEGDVSQQIFENLRCWYYTPIWEEGLISIIHLFDYLNSLSDLHLESMGESYPEE